MGRLQVVIGMSLMVLAGCEAPAPSQVMCWQDTSATPPEMICVPVRQMYGRPVPAGAVVVESGGGNTTFVPSGPAPQPPAEPAPVFDFVTTGNGSLSTGTISPDGEVSAVTIDHPNGQFSQGSISTFSSDGSGDPVDAVPAGTARDLTNSILDDAFSQVGLTR